MYLYPDLSGCSVNTFMFNNYVPQLKINDSSICVCLKTEKMFFLYAQHGSNTII